MNGNGSNRKLRGREKLEVVIEGLVNSNGIAEICRARGISTGQYYQWKERLISKAEEIYKRKGKEKTRHEEKLEEENRRLKEVIAEITTENLDLKKTLGA